MSSVLQHALNVDMPFEMAGLQFCQTAAEQCKRSANSQWTTAFGTIFKANHHGYLAGHKHAILHSISLDPPKIHTCCNYTCASCTFICFQLGWSHPVSHPNASGTLNGLNDPSPRSLLIKLYLQGYLGVLRGQRTPLIPFDHGESWPADGCHTRRFCPIAYCRFLSQVV